MPATGMWNSKLSYWLAVLRGLLFAGGLSSVIWSITALPAFWKMMPASDIAARIVADDRFKLGALANVLAGIESEQAGALSPPGLLRAVALAKLRVAEEAMLRRSSEQADRSISAAVEEVKSALAVSPNDSFLWLMLYSVETTRGGFDLQNLRYLDQSYAAGPREGWISLRRNRLSLGIFSTLGDATQSAVISEFEQMVDADFVEHAALNLMGAGWPYRERLLAALVSADIVSRQGLYKRLAAEGIKLPIAGIPVDERPWR